MSLFARRPADPGGSRSYAELQDESIQEAREHRIQAGAARWRAGALAEAIFGGRVVPRLRSARTAAGFRALVELEVPFHDLGRHRDAEERFLQAARGDEVLGRIPVVFVFTPTSDPVPAPGGPGVS
ncbi:MAG: hypothetical protein P8188_06320 [Gemmatimonadota bacterium]|jgi:hypothetical protein